MAIEGDVVRKLHTRTDRDEPAREWAAPVLLDEHSPGLAPRPLARRVRLIDFEGPGVGELAFELADLVEHISARLRGLRDPEAVIGGFERQPRPRPQPRR